MYIYNHVTKNTPCWPIFDITGTSMHSLCTPCNFIRIYKSRYSHMPAVFHTGSWWHHSYGNTTSVYTPLRRDEHCNVNCLSTRNDILGLDSQICSSSLQHTKKWTVMISLLISNALPHDLKQDFRDCYQYGTEVSTLFHGANWVQDSTFFILEISHTGFTASSAWSDSLASAEKIL